MYVYMTVKQYGALSRGLYCFACFRFDFDLFDLTVHSPLCSPLAFPYNYIVHDLYK